jgi:hypothetical protein
MLTQLTAQGPPVMLQGTVEQILYPFETGKLSPWGLKLFLWCLCVHIVFKA